MLCKLTKSNDGNNIDGNDNRLKACTAVEIHNCIFIKTL